MKGHRLEIPCYGIVFEADRLRRERHELIGELTVRCAIPGAKTVNGCLSVADMNFSSARARQDRAKLLAARACTNGEVDWHGYIEEFCQGVIDREREGDPAMDIWEMKLPEKLDDFAIDGLAFPRRQPSILFGDGGSAKSYIALYIAGKLSLQGVPVALFDWELSGEEHRERMERLFDRERPPLTYCRCEMPLTAEIDRLARIIREYGIRYAFFDSISFACDGRPEDAEVAARYLRAVRTLDIGTLHVAHINKSEDADQKPFGSSFWHNGARCTYNIKAEEDQENSSLNLGFYHRKANLVAKRKELALTLVFDRHRTFVKKANIADIPELAAKAKVSRRMEALLNHGPRTAIEIADELQVKVDTIRKTVKRSPKFVVIHGGSGEQDRISLRAASIREV